MSQGSPTYFNDAMDAAESEQQTAGVPLGGVGAGCCELGRDGRFRNITINNNRTAETRIDVSAGSLVGVRAARRGKVALRLLQTDSALPFTDAGIVAPYTASQRLAWRGVYPCSHYKLEDPQFPLELTWSALTPIIPYDHEASTLPLILMSFFVNNPSDVSYDVSVVVNWENLCGCARGLFPERRGPIRPVLVSRDQDKKNEPEPVDPNQRLIAGLEFGFRDGFRTNAEGNYALLIGQQREVQVTMLGWNERDPRELEVFWNQFHDSGRLGNNLSRNESSHSGALCASFDLGPQQSRSVVYALAWYCPRYIINDLDHGNGYANPFRNAIEVATQGLTYHRYYFKAVEDWQRRIMTSTLPQWFSKMLINNNYVLSTNTLYTKGNDFAMFESPAAPRTSTLDRHLYSSIGSLLFFPNFEEGELTCIARPRDEENAGRIFRYLGMECMHQPSHGDTPDPMLDTSIVFVLTAYRNYMMTGKRFILDHLMPRLRDAMAYVLQHDQDGDGLPEQSGCSMTRDTWAVYGVNSYTSSLWIAALRAYGRLARRLGDKEEALKYEELLPRALESFDRKLWNEEGGYYRLYSAEGMFGAPMERNEACDAAQLAGQWYADFLCLGQLFPQEKVKKALGAICKLNDQRNGVAHGVMPDGSPCENPPALGFPPGADQAWPAFDTAYYASLMITHGYPDRGLFSVQKNCKNIHARRGRVFNQPMMWDLEANNACGWAQDRHMGSLSAWHVLYALQGFQFNAPDGALWLRPHLPIGVFMLSAPLFTPISFGWVKFREDDERGYRQYVHLTFDSPVYLKTIVLRVPNEVEDISIVCESADGIEQVDHIFGYDGSERLVEIIPKKPILAGNLLKIAIAQTRGATVRLPRPGGR
ncbi:MAG: GH116 family glycosyl-hydrolase [Candidatus Hydrogenedentes bacterium]|nr:GH116 family glycosyl-hydrolase [Candidatus Hydrogenedentota bacterium]